ncbi:Flagellar biosynthetic protein FlhB [Caloramator mitchellensis]|uniref:Flagellar biosynthetic protein FlhB n=1 Tax=Caloramator mitchellensis TaxID=908809 RepID=A0A0R3JWL1_CALMK|nr:EscU/YscU/HrcU family type III secretion system export apparatus switch protein [Caloramator mitchellensis]KRQ87968.1 Flagellar biosynthetic protein FlhB [Caloramator mitchellensis]
MRKKAVALKYEKGDKAPVITAIGFGEIAEKIINIASESKVPIINNKPLVEELSKISIGQNIPIELYETVAEILAFIYNLNSKQNHSKG